MILPAPAVRVSIIIPYITISPANRKETIWSQEICLISWEWFQYKQFSSKLKKITVMNEVNNPIIYYLILFITTHQTNEAYFQAEIKFITIIWVNHWWGWYC